MKILNLYIFLIKLVKLNTHLHIQIPLFIRLVYARIRMGVENIDKSIILTPNAPKGALSWRQGPENIAEVAVLESFYEFWKKCRSET